MTADGTNKTYADPDSVIRIMDECPFPIFRLSGAGDLLFCNDAMEQAADLVDLGNMKLAAYVEKVALEAFAEKKPRRMDVKTGDKIYDFLFSPVTENGYVNGYARDVTKIRATEKRLADTAKFPTENPNPVLRVETDGEILLANAAAREIGDIVTDGPPERLHPDLIEYAARAAETGQHQKAEIERGGRYFALTFAVIENESYLNIYGREITDEHRAKQALVDANSQLEKRVADRTASVRLLQNIVLASNTAESLETALQAALHEVCTFAGWSVGHAYRVEEFDGERALLPTGIWHVDHSEGLHTLRQKTEAMRFGSPRDLPGRVLARGQAAWIEDLSQDEGFRRREFTDAAGLRSGMAFPVIVDDMVIGVLEFFSGEKADPDVEIIKTMGHVGTLLGSVAERKLAQKALETSQREAETSHTRLMDALAAMGQAICLFDKDDNVVLFNNKYKQLYTDFTAGYSPKVGDSFELGLRRSSTQMHKNMNAEEREEWIKNVIKNRKANRVRLSTDRMPDGRWMRSEGFDTRDGGTVSVFTDITESKLHEDELARLAEEADLAHTRLTDALSVINQGFVLFDADDNIVLFNKRYRDRIEHISGMVPEVGMSFETVLRKVNPKLEPDLSDAEREEKIARILKVRAETSTRDDINFEPDGKVFRAQGFETKEGGIVSIFTDITEEKHHEEELARLVEEADLAHSRLIDAIEAMEQSFMLFDSEDRLVLMNQRARDLTSVLANNGQPPEIGETFEHFLQRSNNPERRQTPEQRKEWIKTVMAERRERAVRMNIVPMPGGRWARSEGFATRDGGIVSIFTDITESKLHEAELDKLVEELGVARDAAINANAAKSQFLANMSHELRTPLNAIIGYAELLMDDLEDEGHDEFLPDLKKIQGAGQHLLGLINDILDLSKIEVGKIELFVEEIDVKSLLDDVSNTIQPMIEKNANTLVVKTAEDIGTIQNDVTKLRQNLFNLLSNASKFTEKGNITIKARRVPGEQGDALEFSVTDEGIGMSPEQIEKVFEPFTQADASTSKKFGGTGLGLTITREFSRKMGGDITVDSELGKGTTFTMTVAADVRQAEQQPAEPGREFSAKTVAEDAPLVLIIDDDANVRDLLCRNLATAGYRTAAAANGPSGLEMAKSLAPDVITLDVVMPRMDGWSVLGELKNTPETQDIPVVMVTIVEDKNLGFSLGASEYLSKPIDRSKLVAAIEKFVAEPKNSHVLVIEDDSETREVLRHYLTREGLQVTEAVNGLDGMKKMEESLPDLILLDLMMPEMDGFEFVENYRKHTDWHKVPIVVLTAKILTEEDRNRLNGWVQALYSKADRSIASVVDAVGRYLT